jgi:16S rRNA A1518/A1519 N6-dimethyltransferase RsmA/KsgA/DIM1 with predicted DNA glycosylase/AP lyase activity
MQEAAAHRFAGMPYERNSQISILLAVDFAIEMMRKISRDYFEPQPNVSIVFAHFAKRSAPLISKKVRQDFRDFVVYGYNKWAPTVLDAFRDIFSKKQLSVIGRTQNLTGLKPSDLTVDQWIELFSTFREYVSEDKKSRVYGSEKQLRKTQAKLTKLHRTRKPGE